MQCPVCGESDIKHFKIYYDFEQKLFKCLSCSFIFRVFEEIPKYHLYGVPKDIDRYLSKYRQEFYVFIISQIKKRLQLLDFSLLDIGCGNCGFLQTCRKLGLSKFKGVEPQPDIVQITSKRFNIDIVCDYYKKSLFPKNSFHCIYSSHVLEHLKFPLEFVRNTYFHLKRNGLLCLEIPSSKAIEFILFNLTKRKVFLKNIVLPEHFSYFNPRSVTTLLKKAMYEEIEIITGMSEFKRTGLLGEISKFAIDPILNFFKLQSMLIFARKK